MSFVVYLQRAVLDRRATFGTADGGYADVDGRAIVVRSFTPQLAEAIWEAALAAGGRVAAGDDIVDVRELAGPEELYRRWS